MKRIFLIILFFIIFITLGFVVYVKLSNKKVFYDPEYNSEYIININEIKLNNSNIKSKYQFVYIADLHTSIIDENEKDEKIKEALVERNHLFFNPELNRPGPDKIFSEIIDYTNNKKADALLLGGDIIDSPADSNLKCLKENLENLKTDYLYTFGNHDWTFSWNYQTAETKEKYYPKFSEFMNNTEVSYLEYEDLIILAINNGMDKVNEEAVEKVKDVLEKKKNTIVMMHVPLATKYISEEAIRIRNRNSSLGENGIPFNEPTKQVVDMILSEEYNVFYVIAGHVHFPISDKLTENIEENVSAPAYDGNINLIRINN